MGKVGSKRVGKFGPDNPNWRGGRVVDPRGYVLIRVGVGHPLSDVRGYAYEHRLKAVEAGKMDVSAGFKIVVHHEDEVHGNNDPGNLEPLTRLEHNARHRKSGKRLRNPGEENSPVNCECGCGATFLKFDGDGRPRRFVAGHNLGISK